eukprot:TRINITY_DN736_c1_g1_i7.p2 TRINITY_DN736_c1_g1~~TRINITY_DN736_c1_g1_i7.p2  ORF type:complete len:118 (+),score=19.95 TRINITY_DN736_c1_g1_i7:39-356(+)
MGEHTKALGYHMEALEMWKNFYNDGHPSVATSLNNIGSIYKAMGEHTKALGYHMEALEMWKNFYNDGHPSVATSLNNIGGIYMAAFTMQWVSTRRHWGTTWRHSK